MSVLERRVFIAIIVAVGLYGGWQLTKVTAPIYLDVLFSIYTPEEMEKDYQETYAQQINAGKGAMAANTDAVGMSCLFVFGGTILLWFACEAGSVFLLLWGAVKVGLLPSES
jgi:hypothetical protein